MKPFIRFSISLISLAAFVSALVIAVQPAAAQTNPTAQALFEEINKLRAGQNLAAYTSNTVLMEVAQNHSRYQASLGTWTHIGSGGTTVLQRAQAAGYGTGKTITCAENVTFGYQMTALRAIEMWGGQEDKANLLSTVFVDAGLGAYTAENGNIFYTLMLCTMVDQPVTPSPTSAGENVWGVSTTTPEVDGAIFHIVQEGQALESIARAYGITLANLLALNNLQPNERIFPGDVLVIRLAHTPTPTLEIPPSPTPITLNATATLRPTRTPFTPPPTVIQPTRTPPPSSTPDPWGWARSSQVGGGLIGLVFLCAAAGVVLIGYGFFLRRK